ncbi:MAG: hypothetical protein ACHQUC_03820 [Chlamydiales bacterium]
MHIPKQLLSPLVFQTLSSSSQEPKALSFYEFRQLLFYERSDLDLPNPVAMLEDLFKYNSAPSDRLMKLFDLLRLKNFSDFADDILDFIASNRVAIKNETIIPDDQHGMTHLILNLFVASKRENFPVELIDYFYGHQKQTKEQVIIDLLKWLSKLAQNPQGGNIEERLEIAALALESYDTKLVKRVSDLALFPTNLTPRPLHRILFDLIYYPSNQAPITVPQDLIAQIPLGFHYFMSDESLRHYFRSVGFIPMKINSLNLEDFNELIRSTQRVALQHFPEMGDSHNLEYDYVYRNRLFTLGLNSSSSFSVLGSQVYFRDLESLHRFLDEMIVESECHHQPNDPLMCYFLNETPKDSQRLPVFNRAQKLPIFFWQNQYSRCLNIYFYCPLNESWEYIIQPNVMLTQSNHLNGLRRWMEFYLGRYRNCYKNILQKQEQTEEALRRVWPGITIYRITPHADLYPYLDRHAGDNSPYILADSTTNRYIFGFGRYRLILPWNAKEKERMLSWLHEIHEVSIFEYEVHLDILNRLLNEEECSLLSHTQPADVSLDDVLRAFLQLERENSFAVLCEKEKIPPQVLKEKLQNIVKIILAEKGLGDLNSETGKTVYREMKIMFTQTFAAYQNDREGLNQFLFDVAKHEVFCSIGLRKELRQHYFIKFPRHQQVIGEKKHFNDFLNKTALSFIEGFESLAIDPKAKQQWVHTRNYLHMFISQVVALPTTLINLGDKGQDAWTKGESYVGLDFVKDHHQIVDRGNRETWIPEFTRGMMVPHLITHLMTIWDGLTQSAKGEEYREVLKEYLEDMEHFEPILLFHSGTRGESALISDSHVWVNDELPLAILLHPPTLEDVHNVVIEATAREVEGLRNEVQVIKGRIGQIELDDNFKTFQAAQKALSNLKTNRKRQRPEISLASAGEEEMRQKTPQERDYEQRKKDSRLMKEHFSEWRQDLNSVDEMNTRINMLLKGRVIKQRNQQIDRLIELGLLSEKNDIYYSLTVKGAIAWLFVKGVLATTDQQHSLEPFSSSSHSHSNPAASSSFSFTRGHGAPVPPPEVGLADDKSSLINPEMPIHELLWKILLANSKTITPPLITDG